jgi:hypothetical protein
MAFLNTLREDLISEVKLGCKGLAGDRIEVVHIKRSMVSLLLYGVKEVKEGDDSFRVTMTNIFPDPFMLEPLNEQIREWIKSFAHFLINCGELEQW